MLHLRSKPWCSYSLARKLDVTYSVWRGVSVLSAASNSQRNLRPQMFVISGAQNDASLQSLSSRLLVPHLYASPLMYTQTRGVISLETYEKFFSPDCPPIGLAMQFMQSTHDLTGMPWWITIGISTAILRFAIGLPLRVYSKRNVERNMELRAYRVALIEFLSAAAEAKKKYKKWSNDAAQQYINQEAYIHMTAKRLEMNTHPLKPIVYGLIQVPIWVAMSFGLRNLSGYQVMGVAAVLESPEMIREGFLWFSNMLVADPTWILPLVVTALQLFNSEINLVHMPPGKFRTLIKWFGRGSSIMFFPIGCVVPSAICLYWAYSAFTAAIVSVLFIWEPSQKFLNVHSKKKMEDYYADSIAQLEKETGMALIPDDRAVGPGANTAVGPRVNPAVGPGVNSAVGPGVNPQISQRSSGSMVQRKSWWPWKKIVTVPNETKATEDKTNSAELNLENEFKADSTTKSSTANQTGTKVKTEKR